MGPLSLMLIAKQVQKWLDTDCHVATFFQYPPYPINLSITITNRRSRLACFLDEAKVGHAGSPECRRRPPSLECCKATRQRTSQSHQGAQAWRQCRVWRQLDRLVQEWSDITVQSRVRLFPDSVLWAQLTFRVGRLGLGTFGQNMSPMSQYQRSKVSLG